MDKIAVLVPCYNEGKTIEKVVTDFKRVLPEAVIYVYDNNSTDGTAEIAAKAGAVVRHEYYQGKGNVIRRMFQEVDAECYLMVDGDDTYPAESAREMADKVLERNVDMVVGDRLSSTYFEENKRPFHNFGNSIVRWGINTFFKNDIKDIMTGYRAFSYRFVKTFPVLSKGFEIETEMSIHAIDKNMFVENVVIDYRDRPEGSVSKLNTYSDGIKVIGTNCAPFPDLSSSCVLWNRGCDPYGAGHWIFHSGVDHIRRYRNGAEFPNSDRLWLCGTGIHPVLFCWPDPADHVPQEPSGF